MIIARQEESEETVAQNALWEEQERLYTELALESDPERQQTILEMLDLTYQEIAEHGWQTEWERRSYAIPDEPFRPPTLQEPWLTDLPAPVEDPQLELELELH
ncbi:hypothetical protein IU421_30210 [Nocardia cyriacigeorgica]|uniref:hypothetical protein n=1 Tax=Nocardia cyriacigeorgica TaxID=135487 RepID=UPI0018947CBA|nr:hypothetical protein [Nocardia cyriacigeorgica]MBF6163075.1 hypothetical protein [Nocardia cyriacigeorgica]MBF6202043.1 hypothetical protein [Nocardia cyriacigeorgica]MBF6518521.1 hypothetical protein [Nocardia cyriacigeorgica]